MKWVSKATLCFQHPTRATAAAATALVVSLCAACAPTLTELDRDVAQMIEQRQELALGQASGLEPGQVVEEYAADRTDEPDIYNQTPNTINPSAEQLGLESDAQFETDPTGDLPRFLPDPDSATMLDLEGVLRYALANSRDYKRAKESLYTATLDLIAERHLWGPRFFNTTTGRFTGTPEAGDHEQAASVVNDFRVTQRLPYGGDVSVRALVDYVSLLRESSTTADDDDQQSATLSTNINLPLLRGAGMPARESLIQAERNLTYAVRDFERFRRSFLVDISTSYFNLIRNIQSIENQERQVENFRWLESRINALADAGREPFFEVQRAQQQVLFARNRLINTRESYASALNRFKLRIGMPVAEPLLIKAVDISIPMPQLNTGKAVNTALVNRLDLQTLTDQVQDQARSVEIARNNKLPDLDLTASVSAPTDNSKDRAGLDLDAGQGSYSAGLRFDAPLDRTREQTALQQALIRYEQAKRNLDLQRDGIREDVQSSIRQIEQSRFSLALQTRNIDIARKRLRGVLLRLRSLGPRDFIEAQDDLLDAENLRDSALRDLRVNILLFLLNTGQMRVTTEGLWEPPAKLVPAADPDAPGMDELIQQGDPDDPADQDDQDAPDGEQAEPLVPLPG